MNVRQAINPAWTDFLGEGTVALGYDVATSQKGMANPSALTVMQKDSRMAITRLLISWKTREPAVARAVLRSVFDDLARAGKKARRLVIDASSERFYAADIRTFFQKDCPVELVAGNQKLQFRGEELDAKSLLGNMYVSGIEDGLILMVGGQWVEMDHRLVKIEAGRFVTDLGPGGEHGDTFDSGKLAYWGLQSGGSCHAEAVQVGSFGHKVNLKNRPGLIGPIGRSVGRGGVTRIGA